MWPEGAQSYFPTKDGNSLGKGHSTAKSVATLGVSNDTSGQSIPVNRVDALEVAECFPTAIRPFQSDSARLATTEHPAVRSL